MRRLVALLVGVAAVVLGVAAVVLGVAAPSFAAAPPNTLATGHALRAGQRLVSANGRYHAEVEGTGRLVVRTAAGRVVWSSPKTGAHALLYLAHSGQLEIQVNGKARWQFDTAGSGGTDVLTMRNTGVLALTERGAMVWSSAIGNGCRGESGKAFVVDISRQFARMCNHGEQIRATTVTTGASAYGDGTPTGTWHVQAKIRDTTLYPAAGGAYPVKYWVPYDGAYGIHDSPWQTFAYGSQQYKTRGSHGCVHVPGKTMAWLYGWLDIGTRVTIHG